MCLDVFKSYGTKCNKLKIKTFFFFQNVKITKIVIIELNMNFMYILNIIITKFAISIIYFNQIYITFLMCTFKFLLIIEK